MTSNEPYYCEAHLSDDLLNLELKTAVMLNCASGEMLSRCRAEGGHASLCKLEGVNTCVLHVRLKLLLKIENSTMVNKI